MGVSYWLYGDDVKKCEDSIGSGEAIEMEIMDDREKVWKRAKIKLIGEAVEGSEPVGFLGTFGAPYDEGKYHIQVLELLPSPLEEEQ